MPLEINPILEQLEPLTCNEGEYFSHQTALFFLGLQTEPPRTITIVSDRRRRNRKAGDFEIVFVYHGKNTTSFSQTIYFGGKKLSVSSIEKTLIDLAKDSTYAPPVEKLAMLFCHVSYNVKLLLNLARQTSDSVLKRVSLYLGWSGRASYNQLPLKLFNRTPVKLDSRIANDLIWNNLFFCRLPAWLLKLPPCLPPDDVEPETRLWMELRTFPEFCEKQALAEMIFIRETPEPRINSIIENYFIEIFRGLDREKLEWLLENGTDSHAHREYSTMIPRLLVSFITSRTNVLLLREWEIREWVLQNLSSNDLKKADSAIFFGTLIGLEEPIIDCFSRLSSQFFYAGKFASILFFADHFLHRKLRLAHNVYLDISKTYSVHERYDDALTLLEEAKIQHEDSPEGILGHLYYATALVLKRLNRVDEAMAELFLARETFLLEKDHESIARAENALGNLYFSMGHPHSARAHYLSGIHEARTAGNHTLLPSFLTNLGLIEYDLGLFAKAKILLVRAYNLYKMQKNLWNASVTGMGLGKIYLKMGHFFKAMKVFREVLTVREEKKNLSGMYEIYSLLAWICEVLGKTAAAETYWRQASAIAQQNKLEARAFSVGESLQAMTRIFTNRPLEAEALYSSMLNNAKAQNASGLRIGDCEHGLASSLIFQNRLAEGAVLLRSALNHMGSDAARVQILQIKILAALFCKEYFVEIDSARLIEQWLETGAFDPFWGSIATTLYCSGLDKDNLYLKFHISRTPPSMLKLIIAKHCGVEAIIDALKSNHNRAGEFFTLLSRRETSTLHQDEYQDWQKNYPAGHLVFDAPAGILTLNNNMTRIKPGSIPHSILLQLFIAQPHQVDVESLYQSAWGTPFDPEFDLGAFKTTVQRIKLLLKSISPTTKIVRKKNNNQTNAIKLSIAVPWVVIFK